MTSIAKSTTSERCARCAEPLAADARFCAECGAQRARLPAARPAQDAELMSSDEPQTWSAPLPDDRQPSFLRRRWPVLALTLALVVAVAGLAIAYLDAQDTQTRLTASQKAFASSQGELHSTESQLSVSESTLSTTKTQLTATQAALKAKEQELSGVRTNLSDTRDRLNVKASQIETLKSCLGGVSIALDDLAYGNYDGAISALNAVSVSCDAAYELF